MKAGCFLKLRALFYSHDTLGLGHLRRTLAICQGLRARLGGLSTLVVTGSEMVHRFRLPAGVDYVKLPCVRKLDNEQYDSRCLDIPFETTLRLREEIVFHTAVHYSPDLFFVDNVPLGMKGELVRTLEFVRANMPRTLLLLGLRDILDESRHIVGLWRRKGVIEALDRFYDRIFIYGLPEVFDPINEYGLPDSIRRKTLFSGYLPRAVDGAAVHAARSGVCGDGEKLVLVTVGGGADGVPLVANFLRALPKVGRKAQITSLIVLGPDMDPKEARALRASVPAGQPVRFLDFCEDLTAYIAAADMVVSMAGYNTISEILWLRKKAVVVPRVQPRTEQLIRAQRLQELDLVRMIHPADLTPARMAREVLACLESPGPSRAASLPFTAFERLTHEISAILEHGRRQQLRRFAAVAGESPLEDPVREAQHANRACTEDSTRGDIGPAVWR